MHACYYVILVNQLKITIYHTLYQAIVETKHEAGKEIAFEITHTAKLKLATMLAILKLSEASSYHYNDPPNVHCQEHQTAPQTPQLGPLVPVCEWPDTIEATVIHTGPKAVMIENHAIAAKAIADREAARLMYKEALALKRSNAQRSSRNKKRKNFVKATDSNKLPLTASMNSNDNRFLQDMGTNKTEDNERETDTFADQLPVQIDEGTTSPNDEVSSDTDDEELCTYVSQEPNMSTGGIIPTEADLIATIAECNALLKDDTCIAANEGKN